MIEEVMKILEDRMDFIANISDNNLNPIQQKLKKTYKNYLLNEVDISVVEIKDKEGNILAYEGHFETENNAS